MCEKQKAVWIGIAGALLACFLAVADKYEAKEGRIQRNEPGEGSVQKQYLLSAGELLKEHSVEITIEETQYTPKQRKMMLKKARQELDQKILGKNQDKEHICDDLVLPEMLLDDAVSAVYFISDYEIFYPDGTIRNLPEKSVLVEISAELECQGEISLYEFYLQVVPNSGNQKDVLKKAVERQLELENKKTGEKQFILPQKVSGTKLTWKEKRESRSMPVLFLTVIAMACILLSEKEKDKKRQKEKEWQMLADYPEIVGKLALLLGAGMNMGMAWEKTAMAYQKKYKEKKMLQRYAYDEMVRSVYQMQDGIGEIEAYENFGKNCGLTEYRKLSSLLAQNLRKGQKGMQHLLEEEERDAYGKRKARAKTAGEEAGTKLLLPMGIMLVVVLVILMIPAGMSLKM